MFTYWRVVPKLVFASLSRLFSSSEYRPSGSSWKNLGSELTAQENEYPSIYFWTDTVCCHWTVVVVAEGVLTLEFVFQLFSFIPTNFVWLFFSSSSKDYSKNNSQTVERDPPLNSSGTESSLAWQTGQENIYPDSCWVEETEKERTKYCLQFFSFFIFVQKFVLPNQQAKASHSRVLVSHWTRAFSSTDSSLLMDNSGLYSGTNIKP